MLKRNIRIIMLSLSVVMIISFVSCNPSGKYERKERSQIQDYLGNHSDLNFVLQSSGLYYLETLAGTGNSPVPSDSAYVRYTGKFLSGSVFDSNVASGVLYGFIVGQNITGFDEGITLMKEGGKSTFLIPSSLAYGSVGSYPYISGFTPLLFEVELVRIKTYTGK